MRSAHKDSVNSIFVSFKEGIVISIDENSIRVWDPVTGVDLYETYTSDSEDVVIPGLGLFYRTDSNAKLES
jgi:hypothetical protein